MSSYQNRLSVVTYSNSSSAPGLPGKKLGEEILNLLKANNKPLIRRQHSEESLVNSEKMELNYIPRADSLPTTDDDTLYSDFLDLLNDDEEDEEKQTTESSQADYDNCPTDDTTLTEGKNLF
jgi:hypothetical protein